MGSKRAAQLRKGPKGAISQADDAERIAAKSTAIGAPEEVDTRYENMQGVRNHSFPGEIEGGYPGLAVDGTGSSTTRIY